MSEQFYSCIDRDGNECLIDYERWPSGAAYVLVSETDPAGELNPRLVDEVRLAPSK